MAGIKEISVEGCEVIGKGGQGTTYRLDEETIVKLYKPGYSLEKIEKERNASRSALKLGIPTAFSFGVVKCGDSYGVIFEMMNAGTLSAAIRKEPEKLPQYVKMYYDALKQIQSIHDTEGIYPKLKDVLHGNADRMTEWLNADEISLLHELIDSVRDEDTIIHGDFHPGNLMLHNGELLLVDVPDIMNGSHLYDLYGVFRDMVSCPKSTPYMCEISQGLPPETCAQIGQMFFAMCAGSHDPQTVGEYMKRMGLVYSFFLTLFLGEEELHGEARKAAPSIVNNAFRGAVVPNSEVLKGLLQIM